MQLQSAGTSKPRISKYYIPIILFIDVDIILLFIAYEMGNTEINLLIVLKSTCIKVGTIDALTSLIFPSHLSKKLSNNIPEKR